MSKAHHIERLLSFWPGQRVSDAGMRAYGEIAAKADERDLRSAVNAFVSGSITDRDPQFLPMPGELAKRVSDEAEKRRYSEDLGKPRATLLPPPSKSDADKEADRAFIQRLRERGILKAPPRRPDQKTPAEREAERLAALAELDEMLKTERPTVKASPETIAWLKGEAA